MTQSMPKVSPPASRVPTTEVGTGEVSQPTVVPPPGNNQGTFIVLLLFVQLVLVQGQRASVAPW